MILKKIDFQKIGKKFYARYLNPHNFGEILVIWGKKKGTMTKSYTAIN